MQPITSTATLTPTTQRQGVKVQTRPFKITDIPDAMDKMNWPVAAALMRHWFNGKPWPDTVDGGMSAEVKRHDAWPTEEYIEETIVKMDWVLQFSESRDAWHALRGLWFSESAQAFMKVNLARNFFGMANGLYPVAFKGKASAAEKFGRFNTQPVVFANWDISSLSELRGALANFNMRVAGEGDVLVSGNRLRFEVRRLAFYIEDSYDFRVPYMWYSQPLGFWGFEGMANSVAELMARNGRLHIGFSEGSISVAEVQARYADFMSKRFFLVTNSDFAEYRANSGNGGDFRIFSDIKYENLPRAIVLEVNR
ncbi:DUF6402 family protein [Pseudomonas oryzihabitans]|uniref:DUF6402 family protein n=1 Tax=Pseudomonas oryzihabitans TaxID=47885 RepID=UPI00112276C9|nr:DUF6402 family protein [Pseudomonas psychrotolerans]QDD89788.1 hypothetical protein CCZ28_12470 [Pseudomonas psychrotolerans]